MHTDTLPGENVSSPVARGDIASTLRVSVVDLGAPAFGRLLRSRRWTAFAHFSRCVYIQAEHGSIVCVGDISIGAGPLNIRCPLPTPIDWHTGGLHTVVVDPERLTFCFTGGALLDFAATPIWTPPTASGLQHAPSASIHALLAAAARRAPGMGLGSTLRHRPGGETFADAVVAAAAPALDALTQWLRDALDQPHGRRHSPPPREANRLVGLGPGLTPSGDDYLGGVMIALHAARRPDLATALARLTLPVARRETNAISFAHLACAARGQGNEALHLTLAAVAGCEAAQWVSCLDAIERTGATSGWDMLAGALLLLRVVADARAARPASA